MIDDIIALSKIKTHDLMSEAQQRRIQKKNDYYAKVLREIHEGKIIKWNWNAAFFGAFWGLCRKMYLSQMIIYAIYLIINQSSIFLIYMANYKNDTTILNIIYLFIMIILSVLQIIIYGLLANKIYYNHLKKKAEKGYKPNFYDSMNWDFIPAVILVSMLWIITMSFIPDSNILETIRSILLNIIFIIIINFDIYKTKKKKKEYEALNLEA